MFARIAFFAPGPGGTDDGTLRLAATGASLGVLALIVVVLVLMSGMILVVLGRRRGNSEE